MGKELEVVVYSDRTLELKEKQATNHLKLIYKKVVRNAMKLLIMFLTHVLTKNVQSFYTSAH